MLFPAESGFRGLSVEGFEVFDLADRERRRRAILSTFHPSLAQLGRELIQELPQERARPLHAHLPRLDWPPGYEPFCTWLALSHEAHGYQSGAQLSVGVHRDYVSIRLGWDIGQGAFGRFEFLCRHGGLGPALAATARQHGLAFRVYAAAPWPVGSRVAFVSAADWRGAFEVARARGVWYELGVRHDLPEAAGLIGSPALGREAARVFTALLPLYERL
jgi:hypothetical protein